MAHHANSNPVLVSVLEGCARVPFVVNKAAFYGHHLIANGAYPITLEASQNPGPNVVIAIDWRFPMQVTKFLVLASSLVLAIFAGPNSAGAAPAVPSLPATTTWTNAGLQEMVRMSGPISVSIDGAGFASQTGTIDVEKPAGATVIAAYLVSAVASGFDTPPPLKLANSSVSFSHLAKATVAYNFRNHFADVTNIVKPLIDPASAGIHSLALDEGITDFTPTPPTIGSSVVDGESLIVIFDDPAKPVSTVIIMFGAANSTGDSFTFNFDPLINLSSQKPWLSLGISFSNQSANRTQHSEIAVTTSSNSSSQTVSLTAGDCDDGACSMGSLMTVGGIGDSLDLPANSLADDDELYGLTSFLASGDTSLTVNTRNPTIDDNLFQSVLYFEGVAVTGAPAVGSTPQVIVTPAPTQSTPAAAAIGNVSSSLAATGRGYSLPVFMTAGIAVFL